MSGFNPARYGAPGETGLRRTSTSGGIGNTNPDADVDGDFVTVTNGGGEVISTVTSSGTTETIDLANGNVHDITLDDDCTFTFTSPAAGRARSWTLFLRQGTGAPHLATWPGSVEWSGGAAPTLSTAEDDVDVLTFVTLDGGTVWYGFASSGGVGSGTPATTVESETTFGITPAVGTDTEYARQDHTHGTPADPGGGEDTSLSEVAAAGSTEDIDCTTARVYHLVLDDDCTVTLTGAVASEAHRLTVLLQQDETGGWTVTWPAEVFWPGGITPTLATDPGHTDWVDLVSVDGGTVWLGVLNAADYGTDAPTPPGGGAFWPMLALSSS